MGGGSSRHSPLYKGPSVHRTEYKHRHSLKKAHSTARPTPPDRRGEPKESLSLHNHMGLFVEPEFTTVIAKSRNKAGTKSAGVYTAANH